MAAPHTTYMQGSFRAPAAATIRTTRDPTGAPTTSDFVIAEGDTWNSIDEILSEWTTALQASFGGSWSIATDAFSTANTIRWCKVVTDGPNFTIAWSFAGDGSALRDWLGETGTVTNQPTGYQFTDYLTGAWYPQYAAPAARRSESMRPRSQMQALSGRHENQSNADTGDRDTVPMDLVFWAGSPTSTHQRALEHLEECIEGILAQGEPFSVYDDGDQWACRFAESPIRIMARHVEGATDYALWEIAIPAVATVPAW